MTCHDCCIFGLVGHLSGAAACRTGNFLISQTETTRIVFQDLLLHGVKVGAQCRTWAMHITRRGYLDRLTTLIRPILEKERVGCRNSDAEHPCDGFDLGKLGTHSLKWTAVNMLKDTCKSTAVVGSYRTHPALARPVPLFVHLLFNQNNFVVTSFSD